MVATSDVRPSDDQIRAALPGFIGKIQQTPPAFSAIKVDGARAYDLARAGATVELKARTVEVTRFDLMASAPDEAVFEADTGKGCYVRSLGRDLARTLGTAGHITELRRLRVGRFATDRAVSLDFYGDIDHKAGLLEQGAADRDRAGRHPGAGPDGGGKRRTCAMAGGSASSAPRIANG